jgi:hypothetical protein
MKSRKSFDERLKNGNVEYLGLDSSWYKKPCSSGLFQSSIYRTISQKEQENMQRCNEKNNEFPWHMVDSKWNAVARDGEYPVWYLHEERPDINNSTQIWDSQDCACFSKDAQKVVGTDMSQWKDIPWEESLMLRPGYKEKEGNGDDVLSKEEADHLINSVKEYPLSS